MSFQPLTSLASLLKRLWKFCLCHERSRQKHYKNVWEWSHALGVGMDFQAMEWSFLFRNGLIEHIGCKAGAMALTFIQCSHTHTILIFLSYYIHCYVFHLVCQYDDIPLASLIYCKRTFFPMCRISGNVNTLVYFYLAVCTSVFIPSEEIH
jgi:hypothetical protein